MRLVLGFCVVDKSELRLANGFVDFFLFSQLLHFLNVSAQIEIPFSAPYVRLRVVKRLRVQFVKHKPYENGNDVKIHWFKKQCVGRKIKLIILEYQSFTQPSLIRDFQKGA
jgi:hypothetical protein